MNSAIDRSLYSIERHELPANPHTFTIDREAEALAQECTLMTAEAIRKALDYIMPIVTVGT